MMKFLQQAHVLVWFWIVSMAVNINTVIVGLADNKAWVVLGGMLLLILCVYYVKKLLDTLQGLD